MYTRGFAGYYSWDLYLYIYSYSRTFIDALIFIVLFHLLLMQISFMFILFPFGSFILRPLTLTSLRFVPLTFARCFC